MILKHLSRSDALLIAIAVVFIITAEYAELMIPMQTSEMTKGIINKDDAEVIGCAVNMIWYAALCLVCLLVSEFITAKVATSFSRTLRRKQFERVQDLSTSDVNRITTSSLVTRVLNDTNQMQFSFSLFLNVLIKAPILAVTSMVIILQFSMEWTLAILDLVVIIAVISVYFFFHLRPKYMAIQKMTDDLNDRTRNDIKGTRVIHAFNSQDLHSDKFNEGNRKLTDTFRYTLNSNAVFVLSTYVIVNLMPLVVYAVGATLLMSLNYTDKLQVFSDMIVVTNYAMLIVSAFSMAFVVMQDLPRAKVSAQRINEIIDWPSSTGTDGAVPDELDGRIEFRDVSYTYHGVSTEAVHGISFTVNGGESLAIVGTSGSGKTTIAKMLPRLLDPDGGVVTIDGRDVKDYDVDYLRGKIGLVEQKPFIFHGTVRFNIAMSEEDVDDDRVRTSAEIAQADEFINDLEHGYDTELAFNGTNISGGQRQRLSIARILYRRPKILILDDSFSALDNVTARNLKKALSDGFPGTTKIIITQKLDVASEADHIVVLEKGRVAGYGTHDELISSCPEYMTLYRLQQELKGEVE